MGKIVLLDELTINQIAAGEVIERPASVVKELMENSIDAGATAITVEIQGGGIKKIKIMDNGSGIAEDDLEFVFERHATSKIRVAEDLEQIKTMGFRGEALASVAAISHIEMITKTANEDIGHKVIVEGGKLLKNEEIGTKTGTSITITNLFYNTPVRYKFLRKDFTEAGYIEDTVERLAIANPNISIKLINGDKTVIQTSGNGELKDVIYGLYGKEIVDGLVKAQYEYEGILITGLVGKPEVARANRTRQLFFVNNRFIKDKTLTSAVDQAFKGLLPIGKYGIVVLKLEMEPNKIDVNVHPTKLEIRFAEEQKVFKGVYYAIKEALLKEDITRNTKLGEEKLEEPLEEDIENTKKDNEGLSANIQEDSEELSAKIQEDSEEPKEKHGLFNLFRRKEEEDFIEKHEDNTIEQIFKRAGEKTELAKETEKIEEVKETPEDFDEMYSKTFGKERKEEVKQENLENISLFENEAEYKPGKPYKYCGTIFSTYLIIEIENDVYIIDQHAAHERIKYEKIKKNFYSNEGKDSQILLLPDIINLTHKEKSIVEENIELFKKAGFEFEAFGENTIRLIGVPTMCVDLDTKELFLNILDEIGTVAITATQEKEDKFIATIACKAAVKANRELEKEEVVKLMDELLSLPNPFTCPHGRPTAIKMTKTDIEKKFNRR